MADTTSIELEPLLMTSGRLYPSLTQIQKPRRKSNKGHWGLHSSSIAVFAFNIPSLSCFFRRAILTKKNLIHHLILSRTSLKSIDRHKLRDLISTSTRCPLSPFACPAAGALGPRVGEDPKKLGGYMDIRQIYGSQLYEEYPYSCAGTLLFLPFFFFFSP